MPEGQKTEELYYQDVRQTEFDAEVLSCVEDEKAGVYRAVLNRTAFFPEQGGQKADRGELGGHEVFDVRMKNGVITHFLKGALAVGSVVTGRVDWARRFDFMQQHTGEHIFSGLVHARFGYDNVGFHLSETETRLDFSGPIPESALLDIEEAANRVIWENLPVRVSVPEPEVLKILNYRSKLTLTENVRIVDIPGVDCCACCAPHTGSTGQVGLIKLVDAMNYKGGVRLHIVCGLRALRDYGEKQRRGEEISHLLSVKQVEIADAVCQLKEKEAEAEARCNALGKKLLELTAAALPTPQHSRHALIFTDNTASPNAMRETVNQLMERYSGCSAVFSGSDSEGWRFVLGSRFVDCTALAGVLRKAGFRCGGTEGFLQGSSACSEAQIREILRNC